MDKNKIVDAVHSDPVVKAVLEVGATGSTAGAAASTTVITQKGDTVASPTSTEEENLVSASQRAVNLIWETTQMKIALSVIWAALVVAAVLAIGGKLTGSTPDVQLAAVVFLFGVANLVTGFYFGRTNHTKVGGVSQRER